MKTGLTKHPGARRKNFDYLITERCYLAVKEERANDLPKSGAGRDITVLPSANYDIPEGFRGNDEH